MRIHDAYRNQVDPSQSRPLPQKPAKPEPSGEAGGASASQVNVSPKARELASSSASGADSARVESLRSAIQNGTFKVDSHAIASKLVGDDDHDGDSK